MFAALALERDPLVLGDVPGLLIQWVQTAGSFATIPVLLWLLLGFSRLRPDQQRAITPLQRSSYLLGVFVGLISYALSGVGYLVWRGQGFETKIGTYGFVVMFWGFTIGALCFLLLVGVPFFAGLWRTRFRRIFALAKLSFKEALRRRILYAFAGFILVFLFASWFLFETKPEDEVRAYVTVVFFVMSVLLLVGSALVSAFSLPADIKNQTIHTVVTKPVERFEIILGRFLGFLTLMTLVLVVMTGVSLLYILRGVHPEAAKESLKARVALYGGLDFENTERDKEGRGGVSVGREWDYRRYITKATADKPTEFARWIFTTVPARSASRKQVPFEYTFDVYRTTKGEKEGSDVTCAVAFYTWRYRPGNNESFRKERGLVQDPERDSALAEKYGYYEISGLPVTDYHTQGFSVPGGLFLNAKAAATDDDKDLKRNPELTVKVSCESAVQYVGMARYDLYLRLDDKEGSDTLGFAVNFFKSAFGLWLLMALVIGLSVVFSGQLSGVITSLVVATLLGCGWARDFITRVALGVNDGGGPAEAMLRIVRREISGASLTDSSSTTEKLVSISDDVFRWGLARILSIFPDTYPYFQLTEYVGEGFDIPLLQLFMGLLQLAGYLAPWFVLSYYLIRWREIAGAT